MPSKAIVTPVDDNFPKYIFSLSVVLFLTLNILSFIITMYRLEVMPQCYELILLDYGFKETGFRAIVRVKVFAWFSNRTRELWVLSKDSH
jgi:hypothetical protein